MKSYLPFLFGAMGVIGSGVALAAFNGPVPTLLNTEPFHTVSRDRMMEHHGGPRFSPEDREAFFDAGLAALRAGLKLTPDQEKLWPALESALRNSTKTMRELREKTEGRPPVPPLADPIGFLRHRSEVAIARGESLKAIADAAAPLYATLSEEQKHRLPVLAAELRWPLHGVIWGAFGPYFGRDGGFFGRDGGPRSGPAPYGHDDDDDDDDGKPERPGQK